MTADDAPYLTPTPDEATSLRLHIVDWDERDSWQQSVCIAILRGHRTVADVAAHLDVTEQQVWQAVRPLLGQGLHFDTATAGLLLR